VDNTYFANKPSFAKSASSATKNGSFYKLKENKVKGMVTIEQAYALPAEKDMFLKMPVQLCKHRYLC